MFCLTKNVRRHKMKTIQTKLHRSKNYDICKMPISCLDDKTESGK